MTEMPLEVRKSLKMILHYLVDEYTHFKLHYEEVTEESFDFDEWDGDLESIPKEARDHVYFHALVIEDWIKKNNELISDDEFLHDHLMKKHFKA